MHTSIVTMLACGSLLLVGLSATSSATAADLDVVGGQLVGAFDVDVDGVLYDVSLMDGSCVSLFAMGGSDCQSVTFVFGTITAANLASQALLDQVLIDGPQGNFDTTPNLVGGCTSTTACAVATPYSSDPPSGILESSAVNINLELGDPVQNFSVSETLDTSSIPDAVFALWTPVSPPSVPTIGPLSMLMLASILGLVSWKQLRVNGLPG